MACYSLCSPGNDEPSQAVSKRSEVRSLELSFLSGEKEIRTSGSRVVTWAQGRKVNVFCEASYKPETTREKVGFRIRAGWWSSSLCLRAQAELRPSYSVSFPPHLLLSSSVIPRPSSDPASRSLGEFLSLSVARLARWRQPRAMASNLSRNFRI